MNEEQNSENLRRSLEQQFEDLNEALPDLDLKSHLSGEYQEICEAIAQVQIEFAAMRRIINDKLGVPNNASR